MKVSFGKNCYKCIIGYKDNKKNYSIVYRASQNDWICKKIDEAKRISL